MMKKFLSVILAVAMVAAMWIVPASASSFTDSLFFNADFTSESAVDAVGGIVPTMTTLGDPPALEYVDSAETGTKVASFDGKKALSYDIDYTKVMANFTMEAYVNFAEDSVKAGGFGMVAGTYWYNNHTGFGFVFSSLNEIGASKKFSLTQGGGGNTTNITGGTYRGGWRHLTYVHDGTNEYLYEDGTLVASQAVKSSAIASDTTKGFRVGGYNLANNFDLTMECAYVRLYQSAATGEDVAALYENRNNPAPTPGEVVVTPVPEPTAVPTGKIFEVDFSTGAADDTTGNYVVNEDDFADNCAIELDDELGVNVAVFDGWGGINYTTDRNLYNSDLTNGITLEAYVNLNDVQHNMTFIETAGSGLHLQQYNDGSDTNVGLRCGDWVNGVYNMQNAYTEPGTILPAGKWAHLVGTSDGLTNRFYIDGQLVASVNRTQSLLKTPAGNESNTKLTVGESVFGGLWGASQIEGKIAFARIYVNAVDDAEAAELYYTVNPDARPESTPVPTEEPTPVPTEEPTPAPTEEVTPEPTEEVTPEPTPEPTARPTVDDSVFVDINYTLKNKKDQKGALTAANTKNQWYNAGTVAKYGPFYLTGFRVGSTVATADGLRYNGAGSYTVGDSFSQEIFGRFSTGEILDYNTFCIEFNADGTIGAWCWPVGGGDGYVQTTKTYNVDDVHHIITTWDRGILSIYVDGELAASKDITAAAAAKDYDLDAISAQPLGNKDRIYVGGSGMNTRINLRYRAFSMALTAEEISAIYNGYTKVTSFTLNPLAKVKYDPGEELDISDYTGVATLSDGTTVDITKTYIILDTTEYNANASGVYTIKGTVGGQVGTCQVTVKDSASLVIATKPSKLVYYTGEQLDTAGLQVFTKIDGVKAPVALENCTLTGFDPNVTGRQVITVKYSTEDIAYINKFTVMVRSMSATAIGLSTKPVKLVYAYGDVLDTTGLSVLAKYSDGTTAIVSEGLEVTGYSSTASGIQRLTVTYQGKTTSFSIKVGARPDFTTESAVFNVDFRTGSYNETVNGLEPSLYGTTFQGYVTASTGETVADLSTPTMLEYSIPFEVYAAMQNTYTMEAYVNITDGNGANLGHIAGDTGWLADNGVSFWVRNLAGYGSDTELSAQEGKGTAIAGGNREEWNHLVYVHEGDTASYYVNGVLVGTQAATTTKHDTTVGFHIGAYSGDGNFAALGQYAFVRVYSTAATAEDVADLYAAR